MKFFFLLVESEEKNSSSKKILSRDMLRYLFLLLLVSLSNVNVCKFLWITSTHDRTALKMCDFILRSRNENWLAKGNFHSEERQNDEAFFLSKSSARLSREWKCSTLSRLSVLHVLEGIKRWLWWCFLWGWETKKMLLGFYGRITENFHESNIQRKHPRGALFNPPPFSFARANINSGSGVRFLS